MFESLNHQQSRGRLLRSAAERTITLRPLTNLTKKRSFSVASSSSGSGSGSTKKLPIKSGCKVL